MKLDKRFFLSALLSVGLAVGMAACGGDDNKGNDNNNNEEGESKCGNGVIDEDAEEICDIGLDKTQHSDDDVVANDATCEMYAATSSNDKDKTGWEGKPRCAKGCKGLSKGSCVSAEERAAQAGEGVNGILTCGSTLSVSSTDQKATATVSYAMGSTTQDANVKAAIVCSSPTAKIDTSIATLEYPADGSNSSATVEANLSSLAAGEYVCYVVLKAGSNGAVVCPLDSGTPVKASGDISVLEESSTVPYTVAAAEGVVAEWNNFNLSDLNTVLVSEAGILAQAGSDTAASLRFVMVNSEASDYKINKGQNASGEITALSLGNQKPKDSDPGFAHSKNIAVDGNSHLLISSANMGGKKIKVVAKTGNFGGKFSVVADETEIISEFASADSFGTAEGNIPAGITSLYLFPWFESCSDSACGVLAIDSIVIE